MRTKRWFIAFVPGLFALVAIVATACTLPEELQQDRIVNQFFPNFWVFFAHIVAFSILLWVITAIVWKPAKRILAARAELIARAVADAERDRDAAATFLKDASARRADAIIQAQRLKDAVADEAYRLKKEKEEEAKRTAAAIIADARKENVRLEASLRTKMRDEIVDVALAAARALAQRELNKDDASQFVNKFIDQLQEADLDTGQ